MTHSIKSIRKITLALVLAMLLSVSGFALFQKNARADSYGDGWSMTDDDVLTINSQSSLSSPDASWKRAKTINFAGNVTNIPDNAFSGMNYLTTVNLGNVDTIGTEAFARSRKLAIVTGGNLTTINSFGFSGCSSLETIDLSNVKSIGNSAFYYCRALNNIDLESAVTIEGLAFSNCICLESVVLNDDLIKIDERAFNKCTSLETVQLGKYTTEICSYAFDGCTGLKTINLENVEIIAEAAFYNCEKLEYADLSSLISLGGYSFYACESMENVVLGSKLRNIPEYTFAKCLSLNGIDLAYVTSLSQGCFGGCTSFVTIDLYNIDNIPQYAFLDCINLESVDLSNVRYIYDGAFQNCRALGTVTLGDRINNIPEYAFSECASLENINLGKVKTIDNYAFSSCFMLENVDLSSVETLYESSFYNCAIKSVDLNNAKTIESYAFYGCWQLTTVYLSNRLKTLDDNAFTDTSLSLIVFKGSARQFEAIDVNWAYRDIEKEYGAFDVSFDIGGTIIEDNIQVVYSGEKAVVPLEPSVDGLVFTGWFTDNSYLNAYDFDTPVTQDIVLYAGWMKASSDPIAVFKGHSLSLEGDIGVNFYTVLPSDISSDAYMKFTVQGISKEQTIPISAALKVTMNNTTYSVFKCKVPAKNMTSVISASLIDSGTAVATDNYSVQEYAAYILEHKNEYSNVLGLVKDMINYGTYAQKYFNCNLNNLANDILDESDRNLSTAMYYYHPYDPDECVLPEGMTFASVSLSLESDTVLKIFLKDTYTRDVKYYCNGVELTPEENNGRTLVKVEGIPAHELDKDFVIKIVVDGDTNEYKVTYSTTNYCFYVLSGETTSIRTQELKDLMLAFLHYSESAKNYKGIVNY